MTASITPRDVRHHLLLKREIALIDLRDECDFATGHPLFAAQMPLHRVAVEARVRIPRLSTLIVLYDDDGSRIEPARQAFADLGYDNVLALEGGLDAWKAAGYQLFEDVNSYCKAFGELVEHRRDTPSLPAEEVGKLITDEADMVILDARRFDEYNTMNIPGSISVPGAELVLRATALAPDPSTRIVVNCAGRTRSLIGAQSLINAGIPNPVCALRNGTIGWTLAGQTLEHGQTRTFTQPDPARVAEARARARDVAYRAGVMHIDFAAVAELRGETDRTLYCLDVRTPVEFAASHLLGFINAPGGQLVQETDHVAPVRGARIVLADDIGPRADMCASWLAQMGWEVFVLDEWPADQLEGGAGDVPPARGPEGRYRRPYEGTDNPRAAMEAYLQWEYGLVEQLRLDGTHGFHVI